MAAKKAQKFHHGDLKNALLASALDLLDHQGEAAVTIRAVARAAGVSHAAPVNHFPDRKCLITAMCCVLFTDLLKLTRASVNALPTQANQSQERVIAFMDSLVSYGQAQPNRYRLLWRSDLREQNNPSLDQVMDELYDDFLELLSGLVTGQGQDIETPAIALWSMCHGYVANRIDGMFVPARDKSSGEQRHTAMFRSYVKTLR